MGSTTVGTYIAESLPNITGKVYGVSEELIMNGSKAEGAFEVFSSDEAATFLENNPGLCGGFNLDASRSSSAYQDGAKVRPDSLTCCYIIKY